MEEFVISDGRGLRAVIVPEKGATVTSLSRDGVEFLYRNEENLASPERPRCGIPFLFPIFGRLDGDQYAFEGKTYPMLIHGFAHTSCWQVVSHNENALEVMLASNEETLKQYPFRFRVTLCYRAEEGGLTIDLCCENLNDRPMPFNYGFHPYFRVAHLQDASVEAAGASQLEIVRGQAIPADYGTLRLCAPEEDAQSHAVLRIPSEGREVTVEFDESFTRLVLWTLPDMPFLCVEPVNSQHNSLLSGDGLKLLPGQKHRATLRICPKTNGI